MNARWYVIRQKAQTVRAAYTARTGSNLNVLPLEDVVEEVWNLSAYPDPELPTNIHGELNATQGTIRYNTALDLVTARFVIAHEIGHYVLEERPADILRDTAETLDVRGKSLITNERVREYNSRERHELEANLFALELLLPVDLLWTSLQRPDWTVSNLATQWQVSETALLTHITNIACHFPPDISVQPVFSAVQTINAEQQRAVDAPLPALIIAGPGTGKTRTLTAKYCALVESGVDPATILALTFSNKAAEEMQRRITATLLQTNEVMAGRVEISTFHAWGLNIIKQYAVRLGLLPTVHVRDEGDLLVLIDRHLADFGFQAYKQLANPLNPVRDLLREISRAKDELCDPDHYAELAERAAHQILSETEQKDTGNNPKTMEKARTDAQNKAIKFRETAAFYRRYQALLETYGILDYGDLIAHTVRALKDPDIAAELRTKYNYILVDESQDINYASKVLLELLDGGRGCIWAVGDPWQRIYGFRGASSALLDQFSQIFPDAQEHYLSVNYRSFQPILDASYAVMTNDPVHHHRPTLQAQRQYRHSTTTVREFIADDEQSQAHAIAQTIIRQYGGSYRRFLLHTKRAKRHHLVARLTGRRHRLPFHDYAILCRTKNIADTIATVLRQYRLPTQWSGDLFEETVVKDVLSVCMLATLKPKHTLVRVLASTDFALAASDRHALLKIARNNASSLYHSMDNQQIQAELSPEGIQRLATLRHVTEKLKKVQHDAWQTVMLYVWSLSPQMRQRLTKRRNDHQIQTELAAVGQLINIVAQFVRQALPHERSIDHFLHYQKILADNDIDVPFEHPTRHGIQIMTIHKAKGLEFPVVFVPSLNKEAFESKRGHSSQVPHVAPMAHMPTSSQEDEERFGMFVAFTRAQNQLYLSSVRMNNQRQLVRSTLLPPAQWLTRTMRLHIPVTLPGVERSIHHPIVTHPVSATSIKSYEGCPRQFLYQYGYKIYDDSTPYLDMHAAIRSTVQQVQELAQQGQLPSPEALNVLLRHELQQRRVFDTPYADDYLDTAHSHVFHVYQQLTHNEQSQPLINHQFVLELPSGIIELRVDQIEQQDGQPPRWIRIRSGKEHDSDKYDVRMKIYALAYHQIYGATPRIQIYYTATDKIIDVPYKPANLVAYREEIDAYLAGIRQQDWRTNRGRACKTCAFRLVCPT